jgi:hypothetical protein
MPTTMTRCLRHALQVAVTSLFLICAGATAAFAGPKPEQPGFAPPAPTTTVVPADPSFETELRWMLNGAGVVFAVAAIALVAVLWHRSHTASRRLVTS